MTDRNDVIAENQRLREAIRNVLSLRSSYDADRGENVPLVGNTQARRMLNDALREQ